MIGTKKGANIELKQILKLNWVSRNGEEVESVGRHYLSLSIGFYPMWNCRHFHMDYGATGATGGNVMVQNQKYEKGLGPVSNQPQGPVEAILRHLNFHHMEIEHAAESCELI